MREVEQAAYLAVRAVLDGYAALELGAGEREFMGRPDRWYEKPTWRCPKGHISTTYLRREDVGAVCLDCGGLLSLTFPEDVDGPLAPAGSVKQPDGEVR